MYLQVMQALVRHCVLLLETDVRLSTSASEDADCLGVRESQCSS